MKRRNFVLAGSIATAFPTQWAHAAGYPNKPVRLIVPFAPGGSADFVARIIVNSLARQLGQPVIIENKGGAGGVLGTMEVVRARADGYTLLMASPSVTAASPAINPNAGYNPIVDLTPVINVAAGPTVMAVRRDFPARNFQEFVSELKRNPGRYSYGTPGVGGVLHLHMEQFKLLTGTFITHIPFRGAGPALIAATGGQVDIIEDALPSALPFVKDGRLLPIALSAPRRLKELPQVPTFAEVGLAPLNYMGHWGILGPKGLPKDIVDKINEATRLATEDPAVKKRIEESGAFVVAGSPQDFAKEIKEMYTALRRVVVEQKLTME